MHVNASFFTIFSSLFFIFNAAGQVPLFLALLSKFPEKRQYQIIIREFVIGFGVLLLFIFCGDEILSAIGITKEVISIAGGLILFLISLGMIFPKEPVENSKLNQEPLIVPLAIPLVSGPGMIAAVMMYSHDTGNPLLVSAAMLCAWSVSLLIILAGSAIKKILGEKGLIALERLGGMLLCLIGIQLFVNGVVYISQGQGG